MSGLLLSLLVSNPVRKGDLYTRTKHRCVRHPLPPDRRHPSPRGWEGGSWGERGEKNREQNHRMVRVGSDLTDHLIPAPARTGTPSTGPECSECSGESAVGEQAGAVPQLGLCGVSLGLMATSPLGQELSEKDLYIPLICWLVRS